MNPRKIASLLALSLLSVGFFSPGYRAYAGMPTTLSLPRGGHVLLSAVPGLGLRARGGVHEALAGQALDVSANKNGALSLTLGGIAVKTVAVRVSPPHLVALGGQAIGIVLRGHGSTIVSFDRVPTPEGSSEAPGMAAGLRVGDKLVAIDGKTISSDRQFAAAVDAAGRVGRAVRITVEREGRKVQTTAKPAFDRQAARYRLGVYVRDRVSGVGTLTFTDPAHGRFAALGHRVTLAKRGEAPSAGVVLPAAIVGVQRAQRGKPGQKIGVINFEAQQLGRVERNADVGIGGALSGDPLTRPILPLGTVSQVHPGKAVLYTVVRGGGIQAFDLRIERVVPDRRAGAKSLVLRITDEKLMKLTGGIVQGMSGSPIVQDGRLAGAVTHVFIHDPTRGYGTYAAWMYHDLLPTVGNHAIVRHILTSGVLHQDAS